VIDAIFIGATTSAVTEALQSAGLWDGVVAVLGTPRLGRALGERGYEIVQVLDRPRPRPRSTIARQVQAQPASLPLADGELAALVAGGANGNDWDTLLTEWSRVVRDGGVIVIVDRAPPPEMARRALCSGLTEIEQRRAGRKMVTSGCVAKL
jgi:hypothetical protein